MSDAANRMRRLADHLYELDSGSGEASLLQEAAARIGALEAQHREDTSAIAVLGADREVAMKASAAALREVDALKVRIEALEAMLQKVVTQERRVAASTDMTRSAMREGAAELADEIDAALKGGGDE